MATPADRDTMPELAVALAELRTFCKRIDANVETLMERGKTENKALAELEARVSKLERKGMNGSEHPGPQGE